MSYLPPHRRRRQNARSFLSRLAQAPDCTSETEFPALSDLGKVIPTWDHNSMLRSTDVKPTWWGALEGFVYMSRVKNTAYRPGDFEPSSVYDSSKAREKLIDVLEQHSADYYEKFPHEEHYDIGLDYEEEQSDDDCESSDEDEDWRMAEYN